MLAAFAAMCPAAAQRPAAAVPAPLPSAPPTAAPSAGPATAGASATAGTPVRLMVLREVTTRSAKVGDRFRLRVDEAVTIDGAVLIPVGAIAWGEVTGVARTSVAGKSGRLAARLLYVDLPSGPLPLRGERDQLGDGNTTGVVLGVLVWGPLALLNKGDNGKLKAGEIITGYVARAAESGARPMTPGGARD